MTRFLAPLLALAASVPLASASPCGYGADCGRPKCDGATTSAFQAVLPVIKACEDEFEPYRMTWPQDNEAALRAACLGGVCGASFDTLVKWYDIERNVCELNMPKVYSNAIMYISNGYGVICIGGSTTVEAFPAVKAELAARIAKARGVKDATTATPSTTTPSPTTKALSPSTTSPAPTTSSPTPTPTPTTTPTKTPTPTNVATAAPAETASGSDTNETDASRVDEQAVAEPTASSKPSAVPTPTTAATPKASQATKTMVSVLAVVASVVALSC